LQFGEANYGKCYIYEKLREGMPFKRHKIMEERKNEEN